MEVALGATLLSVPSYSTKLELSAAGSPPPDPGGVAPERFRVSSVVVYLVWSKKMYGGPP